MHREIKIQRIRLKLNHNKGIQITSFFNYVANILNKKKKTKRNTCFRSPFSTIWDLLLCRQKARFSHDRSQIDFNVLVSHLSGIQNQNADSTAWFLRLCLSLHLDIQKAEPEHFQRAGQGWQRGGNKMTHTQGKYVCAHLHGSIQWTQKV